MAQRHPHTLESEPNPMKPEAGQPEAADKKQKHDKATAEPAGATPPGGANGMEEKLAALETQLQEADKKTQDANDRLLRTTAEYDNYRRRSKMEQERAFGDGTTNAVVQMLPILDTLDAAANAPTTDEEYKKGVLLTLAKCEEVFGKLGITEIEALGQPFDPELHNAVMQEAADGAESGTVTRVIQKGYSLNGHIVRHSMVAVAP